MTNGFASPAAAQPDGWFVVWTASRAEKKVVSRFGALGIEAWLPTVTVRRRWSDRWRELVTPLFPGYLFARASAISWAQLLQVPGVLTIVKAGENPALLTDGFVATLRQAVECSGIQLESVTERVEYHPGDEVIVKDGLLAGLRGVVKERRNGRQLVIWVREIGRGVAFTIGSAVVARTSATGV